MLSRTFCQYHQDARVPHIGEGTFQDQYWAINSSPGVYLNMDLSSAPQHSTQRTCPLTLEQAFDYPDSFGATAAQEKCQSWPRRHSIVQELPSPRASQTYKRKMTGSSLNERYARMTVNYHIAHQVYVRGLYRNRGLICALNRKIGGHEYSGAVA